MKLFPKKTMGFTLIEMLIVVAILGILAATVISSYHAYIQSATAAQGLEGLSGYKTRINLCQQKTGTFIGCNHSEYDIPPQIVSEGIINGVTFVSVSNGNILAGLDALNTNNPASKAKNEKIFINLVPEVSANGSVVNWVIECSDFKASNKSSTVDGCVRGVSSL